MACPPIRVFISYDHESGSSQGIDELVQFLRGDGLRVSLDKDLSAPPEGWPEWCERQILQADVVLILFTPAYRRRFMREDETALGVRWEGTLIRQHLFEHGGLNHKFIPVLPKGAESIDIPMVLRPFSRFRLPEGYPALLAAIYELAQGAPRPQIDDDERARQYYRKDAIKSRIRRHDLTDGHFLTHKSLRWSVRKRGVSEPLIVHRDHLDDHHLWPGWNMSVLILQGGVQFSPSTSGGLLRVDLRHQEFGVFNNAGKSFINKSYLGTAEQKQRMRALADQLHRAQLERRGPKIECVPRRPPGALRWASGGYLPMVEHRGRTWVLLFFRDIPPIGWNLANGGSESENERQRVDDLCVREATEEIVVLSAPPRPGTHTAIIPLKFGPRDTPLRTGRLHETYRELRKQDDELYLSYEPGTPPIEVHEVKGPTEVEVVHGSNASPQTTTTSNSFITLNPFELGIEVTRVGRFRLPDDAYVLDGETHLHAGYERLIRRPAGLFSMRSLVAMMRDRGRIGEPIEGGDSRVLPELDAEDFVIFDYDVQARRHLVDRDPAEYVDESEWLGQWAASFAQATDQGQLDESLRTLCPATWRLLELVVNESLRSLFG